MLHRSLALALAAALMGCIGSREPELQMGPDAEVTPDGLHRVDRFPFGTLYMRPDYAFGSYKLFTMGKTVVSVRRDARVLSEEAVDELTRRFDAVVRNALEAGGHTEVKKPGPCVARVNLALIEIDLLDPKALSTQAASTAIQSFGSMTLVIEIHDAYTGEPLLRYGRRRRVGGGSATGVDPAELSATTSSIEEFARGIELDFQKVLPRIQSANPVSCEERAGLPPPVGAR